MQRYKAKLDQSYNKLKLIALLNKNMKILKWKRKNSSL
jgi:hypothetical protein